MLLSVWGKGALASLLFRHIELQFSKCLFINFYLKKKTRLPLITIHIYFYVCYVCFMPHKSTRAHFRCTFFSLNHQAHLRQLHISISRHFWQTFYEIVLLQSEISCEFWREKQILCVSIILFFNYLLMIMYRIRMYVCMHTYLHLDIY